MATSPSKEKLLDVFRQASSINEVAEHFGVPTTTVSCWLRWNNYTTN